MVNSERAEVFMDHSDNASFQKSSKSENLTTDGGDSSEIFPPPPNPDHRLINQSHSYPQLQLPKGRRRHCSEGEVVVKEKVRRYRNGSVSDKDLEQVLGAAAWLLALADHPDNNNEGTKKEDGREGLFEERVPGLCHSALDLSTLGSNMKGWGLSSSGPHRLGVTPGGRSASCNTSPSKAPPSGRPLNKYAAILASVGCTAPTVAPCPLSLLTGSRSIHRTTDNNSGSTAMPAVTWAHHTCCTTSTVTTTTHVKPNMSPKMSPRMDRTSPGSTKGIGSKSCSINLKSFSASFNCRTASNVLVTSPTTNIPTRTVSDAHITTTPTSSTSSSPAPSSSPSPPISLGGPGAKPPTLPGPTPTTTVTKHPDKCEAKPCKSSLKSSAAKSSPSGSRKSKSSPKTPRTSRSDSTKSKKSSKSNISKASSSSSKSSSSSSVATIDCETVSVNIPDRPMCVMTTSWTPDDDVMSPMSWTCDRQLTNQNESPGQTRAAAALGRFDRTWREPSGYGNVDNSSVSSSVNSPVNYQQGSILHSDSLSSEADEENNRMSASQKLRAALNESRTKPEADNTLNDRDHDTTQSRDVSDNTNNPEKRPRPRPLSLPSNHKLDLKLCYFDPNIDIGLNESNDSKIHQRSSVDLELDLHKVKRHSSALNNASADRWHSALHPLIHSQSQILQESELSKVAKVKILSRTSWCDCSQEFLMTSLNQRHKCHSPSPQREEAMSSSSRSSLAKNENGTSCQCKDDGEGCSCCHGNNDQDVTKDTTSMTSGGGDDADKMKIPKAPSDEFLTEAMKYTREKLKHRCGEDLVTLLEQFYKQIQSVSEELVVLLQERHDLHEQVDMRRIAIEQLVRLQNEAAAANDVNSIQMSVILPSNQGNQR